MNEFDFREEDIDQKVSILEIPQWHNDSVGTSRYRAENLSSQRKILHDLQMFIQDSKNKQNERIKYLKEKQKKLGEEMVKQQANKEMKRKQLQEEQKEKVFKQCTFKPKVNDTKAPKRNFNQFLENQYAHTQKVKQKCEQLKKNIQEKKQKGTYKPKINAYSKRKQSSESATVFDRLFALSEKEKTQQAELAPFHPTINARSKNMVRDGPVQQILYEDAIRRKIKDNEVLHLNTLVTEKNEKTINVNNEKYAAQKFIKQYFYVLESLEIDTSLSATIQYVEFNELLKKLGFVTSEQEQQSKTSSVQRALVHDSYQFLEKTKVNARNLCVFLLALIGIYHINPVNFEEGEESEPGCQLTLDQIEGRKIQKQFQLFFRNRLSSQCNRKIAEKNEGYSFQPNINRQSVELAEKYRSSMLQQANRLLQQYPELQYKIPEDGVISHTQLLVLHKMAKDVQKERRKQERVDQELKQCTFKPNTLGSSLNCSKATEFHSAAGNKKSSELYEYHKQVKSKKESLQASRHQQTDPQCTFKPLINKNKPPKLPLVPPSKQTEQTLYRMHKGRQEYEEKQKFFERGELIKQKKEAAKEVGEMPTLILQVNLGEKSDRILLYREDEGRLEQVAKKFAHKHGLEQQSEKKLLDMLRTQLQNVLSKIDEDQESQDQQH